MKLANSAQMKQLDTRAIEVRGIPSTLLMTNAAHHIAQEAKKHMSPGGKAAFFCGSGNNGGDGIAAASELIKYGYAVRVFMVGSFEKMTADSLEMQRRLKESGGRIEVFNEDCREYASSCSVIIDAMLGVGLNKDISGAYLAAAEIINSSGAFVIAADIPTGVSADTGLILGGAVNADVTVTFTLGKIGQFVEPGCVNCGEVKIFGIGIPMEYINELESKIFAVTEDDAALPRRKPDTHKGDYGRDCIIAGNLGYTGAPVMASEAALRMGAGLVYLCIPDSIYSIIAIKCTEAMPHPLPCDEDGTVSWNAREPVNEMLEKCDVCLAGPGLGSSFQLDYLLEHIVKTARIPVVLDADGINGIAKNINVLKESAMPVILTPHPGEFARLGGDLSSGRLNAAVSFAKEYGCILVLKGHRTITAAPDGRAYINTTGCPAMAKGGSGDVLAGMIASLAGQKFPLETACVTAVYLHGLAGDICSERLGEYSVNATDIISTIGEAAKTILR